MLRATGVPRIAAATPKRSSVGRGAQWVWMSMMGNAIGSESGPPRGEERRAFDPHHLTRNLRMRTEQVGASRKMFLDRAGIAAIGEMGDGDMRRTSRAPAVAPPVCSPQFALRRAHGSSQCFRAFS